MQPCPEEEIGYLPTDLNSAWCSCRHRPTTMPVGSQKGKLIENFILIADAVMRHCCFSWINQFFPLKLPVTVNFTTFTTTGIGRAVHYILHPVLPVVPRITGRILAELFVDHIASNIVFFRDLEPFEAIEGGLCQHPYCWWSSILWVHGEWFPGTYFNGRDVCILTCQFTIASSAYWEHCLPYGQMTQWYCKCKDFSAISWIEM